MADGNATINQHVMTCPACNDKLHATLSTELTVTSRPTKGVDGNATVKVTGMRITHDCTPQTKREANSLSQHMIGHGR